MSLLDCQMRDSRSFRESTTVGKRRHLAIAMSLNLDDGVLQATYRSFFADQFRSQRVLLVGKITSDSEATTRLRSLQTTPATTTLSWSSNFGSVFRLADF